MNFLPANLPKSIRTTGEVTGEVAGEVYRLLVFMQGEMKRSEIQQALNLKREDHFRKAYLLPALEAGLVEMTILSEFLTQTLTQQKKPRKKG